MQFSSHKKLDEGDLTMLCFIINTSQFRTQTSYYFEYWTKLWYKFHTQQNVSYLNFSYGSQNVIIQRTTKQLVQTEQTKWQCQGKRNVIYLNPMYALYNIDLPIFLFSILSNVRLIKYMLDNSTFKLIEKLCASSPRMYFSSHSGKSSSL